MARVKSFLGHPENPFFGPDWIIRPDHDPDLSLKLVKLPNGIFRMTEVWLDGWLVETFHLTFSSSILALNFFSSASSLAKNLAMISVSLLCDLCCTPSRCSSSESHCVNTVTTGGGRDFEYSITPSNRRCLSRACASTSAVMATKI